MTYKINDVELFLQPTQGQWMPRDVLGYDGNGHPVYPSRYEFEMRWDISYLTGTYQLQQFFDTLHVTGSASISLPKYGNFADVFQTYSGTVIHEPEYGRYYHGHLFDVRLLVTNIRIS